MKINLTDQDLNEWVFLNIFKVSIKELEEASEFNKLFHVFAKMQIPNYCTDLNHTHFMEEKIREMDKSGIYNDKLSEVIFGEFIDPRYFNEEDLFNYSHASARQRCEAAYLTFQENK